MTTTIETDLKEILGKLDNHLERIDNRLSNLELNQTEIKGEIKILDEKLSGQISILDEKITGIDKRLDNQEFINRGILVGIILALLAGVVKLFGFFPNP